jgi:hypothetical protein
MTQLQKRIPDGKVLGTVKLEACKAYPINIWRGTGQLPRIAYADLNTHQEQNTLTVKLLPQGGKTAPHPQIAFYVTGPYHVERLGYLRSDPYNWTSWMEFHIDSRELKHIIEAVIRGELALEGIGN